MLLDGLGWSHYSVFAPCIMTQTRVLGRSGGGVNSKELLPQICIQTIIIIPSPFAISRNFKRFLLTPIIFLSSEFSRQESFNFLSPVFITNLHKPCLYILDIILFQPYVKKQLTHTPKQSCIKGWHIFYINFFFQSKKNRK